jgi:CMP-N-acetylneuraminic acid synthetase
MITLATDTLSSSVFSASEYAHEVYSNYSMNPITLFLNSSADVAFHELEEFTRTNGSIYLGNTFYYTNSK